MLFGYTWGQVLRSILRYASLHYPSRARIPFQGTLAWGMGNNLSNSEDLRSGHRYLGTVISSLFLVVALTQGLPDEVFQESTLATLPAEGELDELSTGVVVVVAGGGKPPPEPKILFSPDLRRCAFIISKKGKRVVFVDGKAGEAFDDILYLQFSADGKTVGYVGVGEEKSFVVVDGRRTGPHASPDLDLGAGGRAIVREILAGKSILLVDGKRVLEGDFGIFPKLSLDGKRYACYTENRDQTQGFVFFEGVRSPMYRRVESLGFSKQGGRFGYIGCGDEGDTVVVDETPKYLSPSISE